MIKRFPINFQTWIDENRHLLKPPVCNQVIFDDSDFIVMVVGGPNARLDYHVNQQDEFFYQIEGNMGLKIIDEGKPRTIKIQQGEIFMLPAKVPHSPQRYENSVGLVIEHKRAPEMEDGFQWYCPKCHDLLYQKFLHVHDIVQQLPEVFNDFYNNDQNSFCDRCQLKVISNV